MPADSGGRGVTLFFEDFVTDFFLILAFAADLSLELDCPLLLLTNAFLSDVSTAFLSDCAPTHAKQQHKDPQRECETTFYDEALDIRGRAIWSVDLDIFALELS